MSEDFRRIIMKNLISCEQFTKQNLKELFDLADVVRANPKKYVNALDGKVVTTLFFEPSTRTRLSFESAIVRLGAKNVSTENGKTNSSATKGESLEDTIRVVTGYSDAIIMRHSFNDAAERAAKVATVPIINAGSGKGEHPTQSLLDAYTIRSQKGRLDNLKIAILGDLINGRTIHSLIKLFGLYENIEFYGLSKENLALPEKYIKIIEDTGNKYYKCTSFDDIPRDVDIMYHTRIQAERSDEDLGKEEFIINKAVLDKFSDDTLVMHPLPRVDEIATDIDDDPRAIYFEQAHNGMWVRMALLLKVLE